MAHGTRVLEAIELFLWTIDYGVWIRERVLGTNELALYSTESVPPTTEYFLWIMKHVLWFITVALRSIEHSPGPTEHALGPIDYVLTCIEHVLCP